MELKDWLTQVDVPPTNVASTAWEAGRLRARRRRRSVVGVLAVAALAAPAIAFLASDETDEGGAGTASTANLSAALLTAGPRDPKGAVMEALITGVISLDKRGCVVLMINGQPQDVVWPFGWNAEVRGKEATILDSDGMTIAMTGDTVEGGGGNVSADTPSQSLEDVHRQRCYPSVPTSFAVLQSDIGVVRS